MIVPSVPVLDSSSSSESFVYELVESAPLPVIDMSRSIRSVWCSAHFGKTWSSLMKRYQAPILICYYIAIVLSFFGFFMDARVGKWASVGAMVLSIWGALACILQLRADIVNLLFNTYEDWFFSAVNTISSVLLAIYFSDLRAVYIPVFWAGIQSAIFVDSNITMSRHFVISSFPIVSFLVVLIVLIGLGGLDNTHSFVLFPSRTRAMSVEVALMNGWGTIALLLCRNIYRRREAIKKLGSESKLIQCVSLRAKVKLVRVQHSSTVALLRIVRAKSMSATLNLPTPMKLVTAGEMFDAANTIIPISRFASVGGMLPFALRTGLLVVALTGLCLTCWSSIVKEQHSGSTMHVVEPGALVATSIFSGTCLAISQRQLLRRILFSFDFAFLSLQITFAHLCMCDLLYWDRRCYGVGASFLWIHWVLTLDALTPVIKRQWGIRMWFAAVVVVLFIAAQVGVVVCLVFDAGVDLQDRSVYDAKLWGHTIQVRMVPLLLSRLVILISWSGRVLWRIVRQRSDELIIVYGGIAFEGNIRSLRAMLQPVSPAVGVKKEDGVVKSESVPVRD